MEQILFFILAVPPPIHSKQNHILHDHRKEAIAEIGWKRLQGVFQHFQLTVVEPLGKHPQLFQQGDAEEAHTEQRDLAAVPLLLEQHGDDIPAGQKRSKKHPQGVPDIPVHNSILPSELDRDGVPISVYHTKPPNRKNDLHKIYKKMMQKLLRMHFLQKLCAFLLQKSGKRGILWMQFNNLAW